MSLATFVIINGREKVSLRKSLANYIFGDKHLKRKMPTCTHINYHLEAQRRARVLERKQAALKKLQEQQEEEERKLQEQFEQRERTKLIQEEDRRKEREEHLRQRGGGRPKFYSKTDKQTQVRFPTQKDLRHQQKVLRDHGLVMGHVNDKFLS